MSAIITEQFRKRNAQSFINDINNPSTKYYLGIGKSGPWASNEDALNFVVDAPLGTNADDKIILDNLTTLIGLISENAKITRVIPKITAKATRRHKAWNPYDINCFYQTTEDGIIYSPCYVVSENHIYLCLRGPVNINGGATLASPPFGIPTGTNQSRQPFTYSLDNSVWVYIATVAPTGTINIDQFVTVLETPTNIGGSEITATTIPAATGNLVTGFTVINGGLGNTGTPVAEFINNAGVSTPLVVSTHPTTNAITSVRYNTSLSPSQWAKGKGYVKISGLTAANGAAIPPKIYPNVAPPEGFGFNPSLILPSWYVGVYTKVTDTLVDSLGLSDIPAVPYREVSIIRNPVARVGVVDAAASLRCLQFLTFGPTDAPSSSIEAGTFFSQVGGARGIVDYYDPITKRLYYHQTYDTGFIPFNNTTGITTPGVGNFVPTSSVPVGNSEYIKDTGEVLFVEKRKKITRTPGQVEEITIILQF